MTLDNIGQVVKEMLDWQERLAQKTRRWPVLAQGIRVLMGFMLIALLMHLFTPGGPFWHECGLRAFYIGLTYIVYVLLRIEQQHREQCLLWVAGWLAQANVDVPGLLSSMDSYLRDVQRQLGRLKLVYYVACLALFSYLFCLLRFMHATQTADLIAIPLLALLLLLAAWPAHRLRGLREEQVCVARLLHELLPDHHGTTAQNF